MTRYEVTGPAVVFGHRQGEQFDRHIPDAAAERALIEAGTLQIVTWPTEQTPTVYQPRNNDDEDDGA